MSEANQEMIDDPAEGLGLAISRDIVLKHERQISVHSDPGKFTEFVVTLPIAPAPVGASV